MSPADPNYLPEVDELRPLFPQFELEQRIGAGGMGVVYRAIQISVERPVALKILPPHLAEDQEFRDRFRREAKAMAKLRHPVLVQVHDFGTAGQNLLWMAQEWIEGETLFYWFEREGALPADESALLVIQACEALAYAHSKGIIHRDIKPANLMLTPEGQVRVMDFGLARATRGGPANLVSKNRTRLGTPEYAAPELFAESAEIDHRADIFALGVLLYQSLTGTLPQGEFCPPSKLDPSIDPRYDVIVIRSMQRDPANRYPSCVDFKEALRSVVDHPTQPVAAARAPLPARRPITGASNSTAQPASGSSASATPEAAAIAVKKRRGKARVLITLAAVALGLGAAGWGFIAMWGGEPGEGAKTVSAPADSPRPKAPAPKPKPDKPKPADPDKAVVSTPKPPTPDPVPQPPPLAEDDGEAGRTLLAELDEKLLAATKPVLAEYSARNGELLPTYVREAAKGEQAAIAAGKLDELLFWDRELRSLLENGELPADDGSVPERAEPLRKGWRKHILPIRARFDELRLAHAEECRRRAEEFEGEEKLVSASLLRKRAEDAETFSWFLKFCGWQPEHAVESSVIEIGGTLAELDADLKAGHFSRLPEGTVRFGENHYLLVRKPLDWDAARRWCEERGGHLATLAREDELKWFRNLKPEGEPGDALLGAEAKDGSWQWVTGELWTDKGWCPGEPTMKEARQVLQWLGAKHGFDDIPEGHIGQHAIPFWIEWERPSPIPAGPLAAASEPFPAELMPFHDLVCRRLAAGDPEQSKPLIRAYGSRLVATRKKLAAANQPDAAKAIRAVEQQLLELLGKPKTGPAPPNNPVVPVSESEIAIVARGEPSNHCLWERREWRRRGSAIECVKGAALRATGILGEGDFEIKARIKLPKIDNTRTQLAIGDTILFLDISPGEICLKKHGLSAAEVKGARLGSFAKPDEWFDISVKRTGELFTVEVNEKPALSTTIGEGPAGTPLLSVPAAGSVVERFSASGRWEEAPPEPIRVIGRYELGNQRAHSKGVCQLLVGKGDTLIQLFTAIGYHGHWTLWTIRSTSGGDKWSDVEMLADSAEGEKPVGNFGAACDSEEDDVVVLYSSGKSNHRVFCRRSANGGGNWKDPEDVTDQVKQGGWNVRFHGQGLCLSRKAPKPGRIVIPVSYNRGEAEAGHAGEDGYVLLSDDGETWRCVGPVLSQWARDCAIFEDQEGILWLNGAKSPRPQNGEMLEFHRQCSSRDGGETWSEAVETRWPDQWWRGSCLVAEDARGQVCWYRCGHEKEPQKAPPIRSHLSIFRSYDRGASWRLLRHIHCGSAGDPTLVFREPGSLIMSFRRDHWDISSDDIGFTELSLRWLEESDHSLR